MFSSKVRKKFLSKVCLSALALSFLVPSSCFACTTVLVGKDASTDGSTFICRNEDSYTYWPKYFVVKQAKTNPAGSVYKSRANKFVCPVPTKSLKYTATPDNDNSEGDFYEAGINELGVAMSATESANNNATVAKLDPFNTDSGIGENAMVNVVLPYINSARDGVKRLGELVTKYGCNAANGIAFSDKNEVWYMEIGSGHQWVAKRIPKDSYAVVANRLAIQTIDFNDHANYMWSPTLKSFLIKNKLAPQLATGGHTFNWRDTFGTKSKKDLTYNVPRVWYGQRSFSPSQVKDNQSQSFNLPFTRKPDKKINKDMIAKLLSSHYNDTIHNIYGIDAGSYRPISMPSTMESHIIQLRPNMPVDISGVQWLCLGVPETSVYVPFYAGITSTPADYHAGHTTPTEKSAYWIFRTTNALIRPEYSKFMRLALPVMQDVTTKMNNNLQISDATALAMYRANPSNRAALDAYLTKVSANNAAYAVGEFKKLDAQLIKEYTTLKPVFQDKNL